MPTRPRHPQAAAAALIALLCLSAGFAGCEKAPATSDQQPDERALPTDQQLCDRIDQVLKYTLERRELSADPGQNAAWQVLHGVLAYGPDFPVKVGSQTVATVPWLLEGGQLEGFRMRQGERGLKAILEAGTKKGQGHEDQWLAVLAQCDLGSDTPIKIGSDTFTMGDLLNQAMYDVYEGKECSWTLIGLSEYISVADTTWPASDGQTWSMEKMMAMEAANTSARGPITGACGGSHRLIGMQMALTKYRQATKNQPLTAGWLAGQQRIDEAVKYAKVYQLPNGAFSTAYFEGKEDAQDLKEQIGATGHTLEFLTLALDKEVLAEPWVVRAVEYLCSVFEKTKDVEMECGALYHAAHGLRNYREVRFGAKDYVAEMNAAQADDSTAANQ